MEVNKNKLNNKEKITERLSFKKMFFFFVIFSFIGCIYEDIYFIIKNYLKYGNINFITKRGLLYFELSPIYGLGACIMIFIFSKRNNKKTDYFLLGAIIGGVFEYLASAIQQILTGTVSWDYSDYILNIGGRTTIPYMLFWGLMSYVLMTKLYPYVSNKLEKIPAKVEKTLYPLLLTIIFLDIFISLSACMRLGLRHKGYQALTPYGEFLDKVYHDERIYQSYTNMRDK